MHDSTQVDEGRTCRTLLAIKMKARTSRGGEEVPATYVTSDLSYQKGRVLEKYEHDEDIEMKKKM